MGCFGKMVYIKVVTFLMEQKGIYLRTWVNER